MTFSYKARDDRGEAVVGTVEAESQSDAMSKLRREGKTVTDIRVGTAPINTEAIRVRQASKQVKRDDVIAYANQLGVMLETGVPLSDALGAYVKQSRAGGLKKVVEVIDDRVTSGMPLSEALNEFPKVFPKMMVNLVRASEASGTMASMLSRIANYMERERKTVNQIRGALIYPLVMIGVALVVTGFLVVWVLPRFAKIYESREAALPVLTRVVLDISNFMTANWMYVLMGAAAVGVMLVWARMSAWGRRAFDWMKIKLPVIGPMFTAFYLSRATRTLSTLLTSGVQLLEAVGIVRGVTNNVLWDELWQDVEAALTSGRELASVVEDATLIPPSAAQMIAAGERTGRLPDVLERIATTAEEDLDQTIKNATQLIEPAMIIFMGLTIGGIAMALLLPIFSISSVMAGG